jgi:predicted Zn-dependent protease
VLDASAVTQAEAWKGSVTSQPASLLLESPRQLSPADEARQQILGARADALGGNSESALARLQGLSRSQPKNVEALAFTASLLAESGRLEEAHAVYGRAIDAWYESSTKPDAQPVLLLKARREVRKRLLAQEPQSPPSP